MPRHHSATAKHFENTFGDRAAQLICTMRSGVSPTEEAPPWWVPNRDGYTVIDPFTLSFAREDAQLHNTFAALLPELSDDAVEDMNFSGAAITAATEVSATEFRVHAEFTAPTEVKADAPGMTPHGTPPAADPADIPVAADPANALVTDAAPMPAAKPHVLRPLYPLHPIRDEACSAWMPTAGEAGLDVDLVAGCRVAPEPRGRVAKEHIEALLRGQLEDGDILLDDYLHLHRGTAYRTGLLAIYRQAVARHGIVNAETASNVAVLPDAPPVATGNDATSRSDPIPRDLIPLADMQDAPEASLPRRPSRLSMSRRNLSSQSLSMLRNYSEQSLSDMGTRIGVGGGLSRMQQNDSELSLADMDGRSRQRMAMPKHHSEAALSDMVRVGGLGASWMTAPGNWKPTSESGSSHSLADLDGVLSTGMEPDGMERGGMEPPWEGGMWHNSSKRSLVSMRSNPSDEAEADEPGMRRISSKRSLEEMASEADGWPGWEPRGMASVTTASSATSLSSTGGSAQMPLSASAASLEEMGREAQPVERKPLPVVSSVEDLSMF